MPSRSNPRGRAAGTGARGPAGDVGDVVLLPGKLTPPDLPDPTVLRPRLAALLSHGVHRTPVTLLSGPPGSGKTVLAASWRRAQPESVPIGWLTLDENDDDPATFWAYVADSLAQAGVDLAGLARPDLGEPVSRAFIPRLAARVLDGSRPVVLVIDNADHLTQRAILTGLDLLVRGAAPRLRLVLCARADPGLPLHNYRLAGTLSEIRSDRLAFTADETRDLLGALGVPVTDRAAATLCRETEGWAVGLRLAAVPLKQGVDPEHLVSALAEDDGSLAQYLVAEVLRDQPASVRRFLLRVSVTDELWPGLVDRLSGRRGGERILASLAHANAFVEHVAGAGGGYRIHSLFREMLQAQLGYERPTELARLHRTCAAWYAQAGRTATAVAHALAAEDWGFATGLLVDELLVGRLLVQDPDPTFRGLEALPSDVPGPDAAVIRVATALSSNRRPTDQDLELAADACTKATNRPALRASAAVTWIAAAGPTGDAGVCTPDSAQALLAALPGADGRERRELAAVLAACRSLEALNGDAPTEELLASLRAAAAAGVAVGSRRVRGLCLSYLALLEALEGRLTRATQLAGEVEAMCAERDTPDAERAPAVATAMAWACLDRYQLGEAYDWGGRARERIATAEDSSTGALVAVLQSRLLRLRHEYGPAEQTLRPHLHDGGLPRWVREQVVGEAVRIGIARGDVDAAVALLDDRDDGTGWTTPLRAAAGLRRGAGSAEPLPPRVRGHAPPAAAVETGIVRAGRLVDAAAAPAAAAELRTALETAEPERLRWPFFDAPPQVRRLLRTHPHLRACSAWLSPSTGEPPTTRRLSVGASGMPTSASSPAPQELSERELEVLTHLSEMLSTAEIAASMFISVNTVRTHIRSILRKLLVTRRNHAVRRAKELGII